MQRHANWLRVLAIACAISALIASGALAKTTIVSDCTESGVRTALDEAGTADQLVFKCDGAAEGESVVVPLTAPLVIRRTVTIDASWSIILDGQNQTRIFVIGAPDGTGQLSGHEEGLISNPVISANLRFLTMRNGHASANDLVLDNNGGAMYVASEAKVQLENVAILNSDADEGGALYALPLSFVDISDTKFEGNRAVYMGGALALRMQTTRLFDSAFVLNSANGTGAGEGGAVHVNVGNFFCDGCAFVKNSAAVGGGLRTNSSDVIVKNSGFDRNEAFGSSDFEGSVPGLSSGGAVYADRALTDGGVMSFVQTTFTSNKSGRNAAAVYMCLNTNDVASVVTTLMCDNRVTLSSAEASAEGAAAVMFACDGRGKINDAYFYHNAFEPANQAYAAEIDGHMDIDKDNVAVIQPGSNDNNLDSLCSDARDKYSNLVASDTCALRPIVFTTVMLGAVLPLIAM